MFPEPDEQAHGNRLIAFWLLAHYRHECENAFVHSEGHIENELASSTATKLHILFCNKVSRLFNCHQEITELFAFGPEIMADLLQQTYRRKVTLQPLECLTCLIPQDIDWERVGQIITCEFARIDEPEDEDEENIEDENEHETDD